MSSHHVPKLILIAFTLSVTATAFQNCSKFGSVTASAPQASSGTGAGTLPEPDPTPADPAAPTVALFGANVSAAEFGDVPGTFNMAYTYPGETTLDPLKAKGFTLVRLPFKWERVQRMLNGPLDADEIGRIKDFLAKARARGFTVILDLHNFGEYRINGTPSFFGSAEVPYAAFADVWRKLALALKDEAGIAGYDLMNEPHDLPTPETWTTAAQAAISSIRAVDARTAIYVEGDCWAGAWRWLECSDKLKDLKDPSNNLIFQAHQYFDKDGSGTYPKSYDEDGADPMIGVTRAKPFVDWLKLHGFRGMIGEYGVPDSDEKWLPVLDNFLRYLADNCVGGTYWSAGPWWGDYHLSIEPRAGVHRPQMAVLEKAPGSLCRSTAATTN